MFIEIGSRLKILDPSPELIKWCKENLEMTNPEYQQKARMHLWLGNTPRTLYLYEVNGNSLILPFGCLRAILPLLEGDMFILHGKTTRNGKSTMLDAIQHLLGDYSTVAPVELICRGDRQKNAEAANPVLAKLKGKRMVTMSESDTAGKLDEATIKQYTGGEDITARELYQSAITFKPQFTMWLSCNDLPSVKDKSLFASDRVRVIEFNRHFTDEEQDKGLKDYFETPEAMRGIFTWLVAGYFKYIRFGLKMSQGMQKVIKQYEKDNDLVLQFLEEKCERKDEGYTKAKSLYDNYKMWCKGCGYYVCSMKKFNAELTAHPEWYADKGVINGVAVYYGMGMKSN